MFIRTFGSFSVIQEPIKLLALCMGNAMLTPNQKTLVMAEMKSEMSPMLNLLEFGEFRPGFLRPLLGICSSEPAR